MWKDWLLYSRGQRTVIILLLLLMVSLLAILESGIFGGGHKEIMSEPLEIADSLYRKVEDERREYEKKYNYRKNLARRYNTVEKNVKSEKDKHTQDTPIKTQDSLINNRRTEYTVFQKQEKFPEGTIVDANTADTLILKKIPGIGSVISRNIVYYRNRLGGFYDLSQLLEVKYVDPDMLVWFEVKSDVYRKISVNRASLDELRAHPYMDFYKAKAIMDFRRKRGKLTAMSQLSMLKEFSEEDVKRLSHYFSFE